MTANFGAAPNPPDAQRSRTSTHASAPAQRFLLGPAVRADRPGLHAHRGGDGDDQPGPRLAVRAGHVLRAVLRFAADWLVSRTAGVVPGAACRHALPGRAVPGARVRGTLRHAAGAVPAAHLWARSLVRAAADVRRGAGDRGNDPRRLGFDGKAAG